jgi:hypothetical protein
MASTLTPPMPVFPMALPSTVASSGGGGMARSPALIVDGATRGKYSDVIGCTAGRRMIGADEV